MKENWAILNDPHTHNLDTPKGDYYYVEDLLARVYVKRLSKGALLCRVKARKVVNGASIPWLCQLLIPKSGKYNRPSAVHDAGFEDGGLEFWIVDKWVFVELTQKEIDYIYLKLMESREVPGWNRKTQYAGLRMGGWYQWNKYRKQDKRKAS